MGWGGEHTWLDTFGEKKLKPLPHSPDKILAKVLQLPLWCVWFWLLPFTEGTELDRCSWYLGQRVTVKKSAQSQCTREILESENLRLVVLDTEMTKDNFQQKHWANLYGVVGEEYVQNKIEITYA